MINIRKKVSKHVADNDSVTSTKERNAVKESSV